MSETEKSPEEKLRQKKMQYEAMSAIFLFGGIFSGIVAFPLFILFVIGFLTDDGTHLSENLIWILGSGVASLICVSMIRAGWSFYTGKKYPRSVAVSYLGIGALLLLIAISATFNRDANYSGNDVAAIPFMLILGLAMIKKGGQLLLSLRETTTSPRQILPESSISNSVPAPIAQVNEYVELLPEPNASSKVSDHVLWDKMLLFATAIAACAFCVALIAGIVWLTLDW